jgi:hypothetical protein
VNKKFKHETKEIAMYKTTFFTTDTMDTLLPTKKKYLDSFTFNETLTIEMAEFSYERMKKHRKLVQNNIESLLKQKNLNKCFSLTEFHEFKNRLIERGEKHDLSKFLEPEKLAYVYINWKHRVKKDHKEDLKIAYEYPTEMVQEINKAIHHHWQVNSHHAAFHCFKEDNTLEDNKEKIKQLLEKMTSLDLMEMVADWIAMNQEYKGNCKEHAEKNIGDDKKWPFSEEQKTKIFTLIDLLEPAPQVINELSCQPESASIQLGR